MESTGNYWLCACAILEDAGAPKPSPVGSRLCPDNRISGGRILKAGTRKVTSRIAHILRMAANALSRAQGRMGEYVRRFKGRLGKAEGIVVGAHKLARIVWAMIVSGQPYDEAKAFQTTPARRARRLQNLQTKPRP